MGLTVEAIVWWWDGCSSKRAREVVLVLQGLCPLMCGFGSKVDGDGDGG